MKNPIDLGIGGRSPVSVEMHAKVIRCGCPERTLDAITVRHGLDGSGNLRSCPTPRNIEDRGRIAYWHRNPLRRLIASLGIAGTLLMFLAIGLVASIVIGSDVGSATSILVIGAILQVNGGRAIVTNRLKGAGTEPLNIGWGTGAGTTAAADTTLFTDALVTLAAGATDHTVGASTQQTTSTTSDTYQVIGTRTATGAGTVTNAGLYDAASGGNLYMKGDFTGIGLAIGDAIQFTCKVQYT